MERSRNDLKNWPSDRRVVKPSGMVHVMLRLFPSVLRAKRSQISHISLKLPIDLLFCWPNVSCTRALSGENARDRQIQCGGYTANARNVKHSRPDEARGIIVSSSFLSGQLTKSLFDDEIDERTNPGAE
jgi:hypothetical protein